MNQTPLPVKSSSGYRVKSHVATRFRQWATRQQRLNEPSPVEQHFLEAVNETKRIEKLKAQDKDGDNR